jgi:hypothetical protein
MVMLGPKIIPSIGLVCASVFEVIAALLVDTKYEDALITIKSVTKSIAGNFNLKNLVIF